MSNKNKDLDQSSSENKTGADIKNSRRKVLRNTLIGGAVISTATLPEKWAKPVLDSVILPTHAATTDETDSAAPTTAAPTTAAPTTAAPTTPRPNPNSNSTVQFNFSSWTDSIV